MPKLRKKIALKLVNEYGVSLVETARSPGLSPSVVEKIMRREKKYEFVYFVNNVPKML